MAVGGIDSYSYEKYLPDEMKAVPSLACFVKMSSRDLRIIGKHNPAKYDQSKLIITDFQGNYANNGDIHEDILINEEG